MSRWKRLLAAVLFAAATLYSVHKADAWCTESTSVPACNANCWIFTDNYCAIVTTLQQVEAITSEGRRIAHIVVVGRHCECLLDGVPVNRYLPPVPPHTNPGMQ